jgi:hypothetical protein
MKITTEKATALRNFVVNRNSIDKIYDEWTSNGRCFNGAV